MREHKIWTLIFTVLVLGIVASGCIKPAEKPAVYEGTIYVSGMGGHFAEAKVKIDPSKAEPIEIVSLSRIKLHEDINIAKKIYAMHDANIDTKRNALYWGAFVNDSNFVHVGKVDLGTGKVVADVKVPRDPSYKTGAMYCASGETANEYLPVLLGYPSYIDVIDKETMAHKKRVYLNAPEIPKSYTWPHGASSPDGKYFYLWLGESAEGKAGVFPRENPNLHIFKLDMDALLKGELKILQKAVITGDPKNTGSMNGHVTNDGKYLHFGGRDRGYLLDSATLKEVDVEMITAGWEWHDFLALPDDKYATITLRVPVEIMVNGTPKKFTDGQMQLYDLSKKELVGKPVSVCRACHVKELAQEVNALLCGQGAVWKK